MSTEDFIEEISVASSWWADSLRNVFPSEQVEHFRKRLEQNIKNKISGHWYESDIDRGSGYRSILCDEMQTDELLTKTARECNINTKTFESQLPRPVVMFINPSIVKVKRFDQHGNLDVLYNSNKQPDRCIQS